METVGRSIEVLRVSVTDRCSHRCLYCMPAEGVVLYSHGDLLRLAEIAELVGILEERVGVRKVRLTGGEPLLRRGIVELVAMLVEREFEEVLLTTNGERLGEHAAGLKEAGLSRVNVSLDSLDPARYRRITRGGDLEPVLRGVDAALSAGLGPLKTNTVVLRGESDGELADLVRFAMAKGIEPRFLEMIAIGVAAECHERYFVSVEEILSILGRDFDVESLPRASRGPSTSHVLTERGTGQRIRIGTIASETQPFCDRCSRLRLTSRGELRACLMSPAGADLRKWVRDPERDLDELDMIVRSVIALKPELRCRAASHQMSQVGG